MIIKCKSCSRKFVVEDTDIPKEGRTVQCGNCSQKWFQMPISESATPSEQKTKKNISALLDNNKPTLNKNIMGKKIKASDGKTYKFLGMQWAELLPSGKIGMLAKKKISVELNSMSGASTSKVIDPYSESESDNENGVDSNSDKNIQGLGFFGYLFLLVIILISLVGVLKTFEKEILTYLPQSIYIFETLQNMFTVITDLIKSY